MERFVFEALSVLPDLGPTLSDEELYFPEKNMFQKAKNVSWWH